MMNDTDLVWSDLEFLTESVGSGRSGSLECNDITSVFAFLAFLFALLNFVVNMGGQGGRRRRRRRGVEEEQCYLAEDQLEDPVYRSSLLSVYALYRGVLDYLDMEQEEAEAGCGARVLCETGHQAGHQAGGGELGPVIAVLAAHRAGWMFESRRVGSHRDTVRAVTRGVAGLHCDQLYPCQHPGHHSHHSHHSQGSDLPRAQLERIREQLGQLYIISK